MAVYSAFNSGEAPLHSLDGHNVTLVAGGPLNTLIFPSGGITPDSLLVTNATAQTVIRITVNPTANVNLSGNRAFIIYPGQTVSWTFEIENPILSVLVESITPATGAVDILAPAPVTQAGNISLTFFEK